MLYFACLTSLLRNPNFDPEEINWPQHDLSNEYYMDIGTHMVEKNGLFLERYAIWDDFMNTNSDSAAITTTNCSLIFVIIVTFLNI